MASQILKTSQISQIQLMFVPINSSYFSQPIFSSQSFTHAKILSHQNFTHQIFYPTKICAIVSVFHVPYNGEFLNGLIFENIFGLYWCLRLTNDLGCWFSDLFFEISCFKNLPIQKLIIWYPWYPVRIIILIVRSDMSNLVYDR